ncbi:chaperone modulator CbpM [Desulforamulus ruminis]|uniref:MerR family transcriptional regulator n=1 Tax=Desulforamulus ruminis (strain ATCC 23193 / DSM 2154 / NCIMB 8452 / DL) TaxID=696281 RepID=F6DNL5_DESRL|nr:chaperone modulator CbpM [Desulforamulus ruminis]AEG58555.1 hypothetical protein Desru_0258 [Desulforamulus ruminis DSM 2154]
MVRKYYLQIYRHPLYSQDEAGWVQIQSLGIHPEVVRRLAELGIVEVVDDRLRADEVRRLYKVLRLRQTLGVNLPGASIIADLLDRIESLQQEVERLRRR